MGRDAELAALTEAIAGAERGDGRVVLLSGEAGIGKSRLATEILTVARDRGMLTLEGRANPLHTGLAYAPIVEALRRHLGRLSEEDFAVLLHGLDDLGRLLADPRLPPAVALHDPELEKTRIFDAVTQLLHRIAQSAPLLLFLDDLHWADLGTIELAHYIGRGLAGRRALLLATYRTGEADGPLRDLAVSVRRSDKDSELNLAPLPDSAVAELISFLLPEEPGPEILRSVTARARGVPLFVTALVQAGSLRRPHELPVIIRDLVLGMLHGLPEPQRRLVELVSVAGDAASDEVIRAVWDVSDVDVRTVLRQLLGRGLIVEQVGRAVTYRVGHPLYAEVAYAELTAVERRAVHAALAAAIDRLDPDNMLALAPHYLGAGDLVDPDRAGAVLAEAGWRALDIYADDEAVRYLSAAATEARAADKIELLPALLEGAGLAEQRGGRLDKAIAAWSEALDAARQHGLVELAASLRTRLALAEEELGNPTRTDRPTESAGPEDALLRLISVIRQWDTAGVRAIAGELASFKTGSETVAHAANELGQAFIALLDNDFTAAKSAAADALRLGELCADESPILATLACRRLIGLSILDGQLPAALTYATLYRVKVRRVDFPSALPSAQYSLAIAYYLDGNPRGAMEAIDGGLRLGQRAHLPRAMHYLLLGKAFLLAEQGKPVAAERALAEAAASGIPADATLRALTDLVLTSLALQAGEPDQVPARADWALYYEPMVMSLGMLFGGLGALAAGDTARAAAIANRMRATNTPFLGALADRLTGLAGGDVELLRSAVDRLGAMGFPVLAAQTRLEWAELVSADAAREAVVDCLRVFEKAGLTPWEDRGRKLARSLGLRATGGRTAGVLSKREAQIAQLVADGLSNADIASRLFLSERTVETHLRNAYTKLGLSSRVALARWVGENVV
jgi:DNA-binding CsgD family transcriptional regulator